MYLKSIILIPVTLVMSMSSPVVAQLPDSPGMDDTADEPYYLDGLFIQSESDQRQGAYHMKMGSKLLGPSILAEFATSTFNDNKNMNTVSENYSMFKLETQSSWSGFNIGAVYQSVGDDFEKLTHETATLKKEGKKDKLKKGLRGTEFWAHRQFGNVGVKAFAMQHRDNPNDDENAPSYTTQKMGGSVDYFFSNLPQLGISIKYASGLHSSSNESAGYGSVDADVSDIESSIFYGGNLWSGSIFVGNSTDVATTSVADIETYYAEASYIPHSAVSISPSISYVSEGYPELNVSTDSFSTAMSVSFKPNPIGLNYSLYSEYSTEENIDWGLDYSYLYTSLGVNWDAKRPKSLIKQWSLELYRDQYVDNVYRDNNVGGFGFMLNLRSSPLNTKRYVDGV